MYVFNIHLSKPDLERPRGPPERTETEVKIMGSRRNGLTLALLVGALALIAVVVAALLDGKEADNGARPTPTASEPFSAPSPSSATSGNDEVVDRVVADRGWVPEPITQDPEVYARTALEAAGTFDTRFATRAEWVAWLGSWFTPSPLYVDEQDALDQMAGYKAELDQSVVLPQARWDDLAGEDGRVSAQVDGDIEYLDVPETTQKDVRTATANVVMIYTTSASRGGGEVTYKQTVRVSVQVVCGGASVPVPGSAQQAGDCKVVRFFDAAVG